MDSIIVLFEKYKLYIEKKEDMRLSKEYGDIRYVFFLGERKRAIVVKKSALKVSIAGAKGYFGFGYSVKAKRHKIYKELFKYHCKKGMVKKGKSVHWDWKCQNIVNKLYPDEV